MSKATQLKRFLLEKIRPKSIKDLDAYLRQQTRGRPNEMRTKIKLLVIDDKAFTPLANLQRYHFNIVHWDDIQSIENVGPFQVILSDIDGVGISMNPQQQGVGVIAEIRRNFPEKYVIAYTGKGSSQLTERAIQIADDFLKKDADIDDWVNSLDRAVESVTDPVFAWRRTCFELLKAGATSYEIALLEDVFVSGIIDDQRDPEDELKNCAERINLSQGAKSIVLNLISSSIFEFANSMMSR